MTPLSEHDRSVLAGTTAYITGQGAMLNREGLWWTDAPLPRRRHTCQPWTWWMGTDGNYHTWRCACGALRTRERMEWTGRNARRSELPWWRRWL